MDALNFDEDIATFLELGNNPYYFSIKDELDTFPKDMIDRMNQKLLEIVEEDSFKFKTITLKLVLTLEYTASEDHANALKIIEDVENEITSFEKNHCQDTFFEKISVALKQMLKTYKIYNFIIKCNLEEAQKVLNNVVSFQNLNNENSAGVYGIRSAMCMEYGLCGNKLALNYAKKANEIDPTNYYWLFLIGKSLGRIRRVEKPYDIPSDEERNALKKAIENDENYLFTLFAAQVYAETASRTYKFHSRNFTLYAHLKNSIDRLNEEADTLYRKAIEKQPNCSHVLFRAAKGFMYLPYPQKDVEYAKELLLKGLEIAPRNPFANHLLAQYYERYGKNIDMAIKHLEICVEQDVFGAHMDLIKLQYQKNQIDAMDKLKQLVTVYEEKPRKCQILTQMVSYYVFVETNLVKACELMKECIKMDYDDNIANHRSLFVQLKESFSLIDVLIDEIKIKMEERHKSEEFDYYKKFLNDMTESNITFRKGRAKHLKNKLLKEEEELKSKYSIGKNTRRPNNKNRPYRNSNFAKSVNGRRFDKSQTQSQTNDKTISVDRVDTFFNSWRKKAESEENLSEKSSDARKTKTDYPSHQNEEYQFKWKANINPSFKNFRDDNHYSKPRRGDGGGSEKLDTEKRNSSFDKPNRNRNSFQPRKPNSSLSNDYTSKNNRRFFDPRFNKSSANQIRTDEKEFEKSFANLNIRSGSKRNE